MKVTLRYGALLAGLTIMVTGCAIPVNSPEPILSKHRPVHVPKVNVLPPAQMLMHPGPGVDGPGPGVFMTGIPVSDPGMLGPVPTSQIGFVGMDGMQVNWDVTAAGAFDSEPLVFPGNYNFPQGAIYRLKLTHIPGQEGVELYPTIEVAPTTPRSEAFLAHNYIPFQLTNEDFAQVLSGNFVTKVIYLPDAEHQELALAGVETLVSTRLDPGVDPIVEADRKGTILAIIRLGNKNLATPGAGGPQVVPASYSSGSDGHGDHGGYSAVGGSNCGPGGCDPYGAGYGGGGVAAYLAGVTAPSYGMPITGTPIGLPGPPHIPLGGPAGLKSHVIQNHTRMHIPAPIENFKIDVKQKPGLSYPQPPNHVHIVERNSVQRVPFLQPKADRNYLLPGEMPPIPVHGHHHGHHGGYCEPGVPCENGDCAPGTTPYDAQ